MNTKEFGKLRFIVYKEKDHYVGVCLELDEIVIEKTATQAAHRIFEASRGYVETVIKENLSDDLLNQKAPIKYYLKYYKGKLIRNMVKTFETPVVKGHFKFAI